MKIEKSFMALAISCFMSIQAIIAQEPSFEWVKQMGGSAFDYGYSITTDESGNIYTTGKFRSTVDFDPGEGTANLTSVGTYDMFVQKLDANGDFLWVKHMGSSGSSQGHSIVTDNLGNVHTIGFFEGTIDSDPGIDSVLLNSSGYSDVLIQKLDTNGDFIWARQVGGTNGNRSYTIAIDDLGNIYTTGYFEGTSDFDPGIEEFMLTAEGAFDIFILKLDANGDFVWAKSLGGDYTNNSDVGYAITVDVDGDVYLTGQFGATADFDAGADVFNLTSVGYHDAFILKLNTDGDFLWVKQIGATSQTGGRSIVVDNSGNVFTTGYFRGTADLDPGLGAISVTPSGTGNKSDVFILKLDANGDFLWAHQLGGDGIDLSQSITLDADGNVFTTGYFQETVDFDPGEAGATYTADGEYNSFIQKLDTDGNFLWVNIIGGIGVYSTDVDVYGNIYTTGYFEGIIDFDPGEEVYNLTSNTQTSDENLYTADIFIQKLSECIPVPPVSNVESLSDLLDQCMVFAPEAPTANDGCGRIITGTTTTVFPITTQGSTAILWTYDDEEGNTATQTQMAIITDVTAPISDLSTLPVVTAECAIASIAAPTATDNCVGNVVGITNTVFPITVQGTAEVLWVYDDGNGNVSNQIQVVIINDVTAPVPYLGSLPNLTALCELTELDLHPPMAIDNCNGIIAASDILLPITNQSTTEVIWTFDDGNGNVVTQSQNINWLELDVSTVSSGFTITANNDIGTYQWVDCDNNNTPLAGETNQSFTPTENGNYAVEITEDGCVALSDCVSITTLGLREVDIDIAMEVYPNPSSGVFNILFDNPVFHAVLTITDASGKLVSVDQIYNTSKAIIMISEPPGAYLLTISTEKGNKTVRLVKE